MFNIQLEKLINLLYLLYTYNKGDIIQLVECRRCMLKAQVRILVSPNCFLTKACEAQLVERNVEVVQAVGSNPITSIPYMFILLIILILLSNAINLIRDMAILYNRISLVDLFYCGLISYITINIISKSIGFHGGLLQYTNFKNIQK